MWYFIIIGHQYYKPRLKELCRYSEDVSKCWTDLALELDLPSKTIDTLDIDYTRIKDKCRHMFNRWLERSPDPCWCDIIEALKMIKMSHLATDIEADYLGVYNDWYEVAGRIIIIINFASIIVNAAEQ